ncbi:MAG: hypothetical protein ACE14L_02190 [Terriglobales bacterium]
MNLLLLQLAGASDPAGVLALCFAMTVALLVYVFYIPAEVAESPDKTRAIYLRERKDAVYENLRDLNFEYKAGKVSDGDYGEMRAALEDEAAALLAEIELLENGGEKAVFSATRLQPAKRSKGNRK